MTRYDRHPTGRPLLVARGGPRAARVRRATPCPPLAGDTTADVVILGGGYTGMWTAWFLKELRPRRRRRRCSSRTSAAAGRAAATAGSSTPSGASSRTAVRALRRREPACALCAAGEDSVERDRRVLRRPRRRRVVRADGDLGVATSAAQVGEWADHVIRPPTGSASRRRLHGLTPEEVRARFDSPVFRGGVFTPFGATVQPARLARGLRNALLERGVRIFEHTPVTRSATATPCVAETPGGTVRAGAAVLGAERVGAALETLPARDHGARLLHRAHRAGPETPRRDRLDRRRRGSATTARRCTTCAPRPTGGSRSASAGCSRTSRGTSTRGSPTTRHRSACAIDDLHRMFPTFADVPIEAAWGGPIDVSGDHLPFFGTLERARSTTASATRATASARATSAGGSSRTARSDVRRRARRCRSSTSSRSGSRRSRSARPAPWWRTARSTAATRRSTTTRSRTRSSTSSRSSRGGSATTSARDATRRRHRRARRTSPGGWRRRSSARVRAANRARHSPATTRADVVILGGGYTGMWTAWFLRSTTRLDVVLLKAGDVRQRAERA